MIEDVFRIIKADRYTKDGCDEIQKAKDTLAEDEKYNIGDISKKTGLMKTANGWVEPKKAKAGAGKPKQDKVGNFMKAYERGDFGKYQQNAEQKKAENFFKQSKSEEKPKSAESKPANTEWETKGKYQIKKFKNENDLDKFLKSNGYLYKDEGGTSFSEKGQIHETVYKKGNETLVKAVGPGIQNPTIRRKSAPSTESKPTPDVKLGGGADTYYFEDPENMSNEDKVFKSLSIELGETFGDHDGDPGNTETWANRWLDNIQNEGGIGIKSKKTRQPTTPVSAEEVMKIVEENPARWNRIIGNAKKFYEGKGKSTNFESDDFYPIKLVGGKTKPSSKYYAESKRTKENASQFPLTAPKDAAPRQLTGDCKVKIRKG